ncbi:hypothetical protein BGZ76_002059 [Entomortierella beljakovae]|nr:hypothetical protein BGZ76_002059 [Entomortierella beljakovae]
MTQPQQSNQLLNRSPIFSSTPYSPSHSPENMPITASSSTSSLDQIPPPPFCEVGATPAPSDEHPDMVSHDSQHHLEDDENIDEVRAPAYVDYSRPTSPTIHHAVIPSASGISMDNHEIQRGDLEHGSSSSSSPINAHITSFFTAPPAPTNPSQQSITSPFSFFSNSLLFSDDQSRPSHQHVKTLKIELEQSEIILMGGSSAILKGTLLVNLSKNTKVKSLQLEFTGRSSVTWVDDNAYSPATRHTTAPHIEHTWDIISNQNKKGSTILAAGQHAYPFTLELPGNLPETLTTAHGKVAYRLSATLTRAGITFTSSNATAFVKILRRHTATAPGARTYHRGIRVRSAPEDKILYSITVPQVRVPHGAKIPLQVSITSPNSKTVINVLQVGLWERVVYKADGRRRVDMRLVKIQKSEGWPQLNREDSGSPVEAVTWNKVLLFDMPDMGFDINQCNPSVDNGLMKVSHILRFSILGFDGTKRYRNENEIELKVLAFEDEFLLEESGLDEEDPLNELPSYLTSFSTPRVSIDEERDLEMADDALLQALVARIHLPTYAESEEDTNSRNPSRDVSRNVSRAPSRSTSPDRMSPNDQHDAVSPVINADEHPVFPLLSGILHPHPVFLNRPRHHESSNLTLPTSPVYQPRTASPLRGA